jgi:hypothetical protein
MARGGKEGTEVELIARPVIDKIKRRGILEAAALLHSGYCAAPENFRVSRPEDPLAFGLMVAV